MKQKKHLYWANMIMAAAVFSLACNTDAVLVITTSSNAPGTDIIISQTDWDVPEQVRKTANTVGSWRELGQTFLITSAITLDKLSLLVSSDTAITNGGNSIAINIWTASSASSSNGVSLIGGGESGTLPAFPGSTKRWMTFDLTDVNLSPGLYGFTIGFPTIGFTNNFASTNQFGDTGAGLEGIWLDQDDPYAGGQAFRLRPTTGASDLSNGADNDLAFVLQGFTPIPEPTAAALLTMGSFLMLFRRTVKR